MKKRYWQTSDFWIDTGERIVSTFLFAVAGNLWVENNFDWKMAAAAGLAATLSAFKAAIGGARNSTTPASLL